ncbi:MAG: hypothetical protein IJ621_06240 [Paludibacteraceae bacterium]|nr:hypothetical protein [Paludibacteraceae bacterium]
MKKISLLMCAVASFGMLFTSCEKKKTTPIETGDLLTSGAYVVGEATGYADLQTTGVVATGMAQGLNEVSGEAREGMYEKYIVLEANKDFQIVFKEGQTYTYYGAALEAAKLATDGQELDGWKGALTQDAKMQVGTTGFYHIILDFNRDGLLDATGGAQIVVAPVEWGLAGSMNSWGYLAADAQPTVQAKQAEIIWTWDNVELMANTEFKFKHSGVWKINLDDAEQVKANSNLGAGMIPNGANIVVESGGIYQVGLIFRMAKGDIAASYAYAMEKTGEIVAKDYSAVRLCLVGDAVAAQEGAEVDPANADGGWAWGNRFDLGTPTKNGDDYTWTASVNLLAAGGCKVRSYSTTDELYVEAGMDGGSDNITVPADGLYTVTFTLNALTNAKTVLLEGEGGAVEPEKHMVTVRAQMPSDWTNTPTAWVWPTGGDGAAVELVQEGNWFVYTTPEAVVSLNIIFRNGDNWDNGQTVDITGLTENICLQIEEAETEIDGKRAYHEINCE